MTAATLERLTFGSRFFEPATVSPAGHPPLAAFASWTGRYLATTDAPAKAALAAEGVALSQARRVVFAGLIRSNPAGALAVTVPAAVREQLPAQVTAQLEERVSGRGDLHVYATTPTPGGPAPAEPTFRTVTMAERSYRAYVFGRREGQSSKRDVSLAGVALDGALALSASPVRVLDAAEMPDPGKGIVRLCPVSGFAPATAATTAPSVEVGDTVVQLCHVEHVGELERRLVRAENRAGPYPGALVPEAFSSTASAAQASESAVSAPTTDGAFYPPEWTMGPKRVLVMVVDFPDLPGLPYLNGIPATPNGVLPAFFGVGGADEFFDRCSYGQTSFVVGTSDFTKVLRLPKKASVYASGGEVDALFADALSAARKAGFNPDAYDRQLLLFTNIAYLNNSRFDFGGLGEVGGRQLMLNGTLNPLIHELGHTYGLRHANLWKTTDGTVTGAGSSVEYGDPSDAMGDGGNGYGNPNYAEFNMWSRNLLGWLPDSSVQTVTTSGTYRVSHFDNRPADLNRTLAIKIPGDVRGDAVHDYWIGTRTRPATGFFSSAATAYILWGYHDVHPSDLLDMKPFGGPFSYGPGLFSGNTFSENGITITPVVVNGGTPPSDQIDVQIILGSIIKLSAADVDADVQTGRATITLNRTGTTSGVTRMRYQTVDGTALAGVDYSPASGEVVWADGETAAKTITVPLLTNPGLEAPKTFSVQVNAVPYGNGGLLGPALAKVHIPGLGSVDQSYAVSGTDIITSGGGFIQADGSTVLGSRVGSGYQLIKVDGRGKIIPGYPVPGTSLVPGQIGRLAQLPDGKMLIVNSGANPGDPLQLSRLNADGTIDPSFVYPRGILSRINSLAVQPDGRILLGGENVYTNLVQFPVLVRLNPDGSRDSTFRFALPPPGPSNSSVSINSIVLQPDGKILVGGYLFAPDGNGAAGLTRTLARLNADGTFDDAFNHAVDAIWFPYSYGAAFLYTMMLQPDGKILLGGLLRGLGGSNNVGPALARLMPDGSLDGAFRPTFVSTSPFGAVVSAMSLQSDGRIVVGGDFYSVNGASHDHLARLNADGGTDATFDSNLPSVVPAGSVPSAISPLSITSLQAQSDGRLLAFYSIYNGLSALGPSGHVARLFGSSLRPGVAQFGAAGVNATPGTTLALSVRRIGGSDGAVSVNYATQNGSASDAAGDYGAQSSTLSWAAGDNAPKTILIPIGSAGAGKDFVVNLGIPLGGVLLGDPASTRIFIGGTAGALTITSPLAAAGDVGQAFNYAITTNGGGTAAAFDASGLPSGLSVDHATGRILGAPTVAGTFGVNLTATSLLGSGSATLTLTVAAPPPPPSSGHAPFFNGENALGNEIYYLAFSGNGNIFGYYAYLADPRFIYHFDLGYEYWWDAGNSSRGIFFYDFASKSFFYTAPDFPFPYLYDFSLNAFLYYFPDPNNPQSYNTNGVRYFYNLSTGQIITK